MEYLVTVVIPTYGRSNTIVRAIESVLNQSINHDLEIIVVDDNGKGSSNQLKTQGVIHGYRKLANFTYLVNENNSGGSFTRNQGLNNAKGEFVTFLDDDDEIDPTKLEKQVNKLQELGEDYSACYCMYKRISPDGKVHVSTEKVEGDMYYYALCRSIDLGSGSNFLVRTKDAKRIGGYDVSFKRYQDLEFFARILKGKKLAFVDEALMTVHHEVRENKFTYWDIVDFDRHYMDFFKHDISELDGKKQKKFYQRVALERFYYSLVHGQVKDSVQNMIRNKVSFIAFIRFCFYLVYIYVTKKQYSFKL